MMDYRTKNTPATSWRSLLALAATFLTLWTVSWNGGVSYASAKPTIGAAASLRDVLLEAVTLFHQGKKNELTITFAASSTIARQVKAGANLDGVIFADHGTMDRLQAEGKVIPKSRKVITANRIVLAVPNSEFRNLSLSSLLEPDIQKIALSDESVPIGYYGKAVLENAGQWPLPTSKRVKPPHVRAALSMIAKNIVQAGFIYQTDAMLMPEAVKVAWRAPTTFPRAEYPGALTVQSSNPAVIQSFFEFLRSKKGQALFAKHGFEGL